MTTTEKTDAAPTAHRTTPPPTDSAFTRFSRTVSDRAMTYFGQHGAGGPSAQPVISKAEDGPANASQPTVPGTDGLSRAPTAFERFMSLGKSRKDWEVEFPPSHWTDGVERSESPSQC